MRWCRFDSGAGPRFGIIDGDTVTEVSGSPFAEHAVTPDQFPLDAVREIVIAAGRSPGGVRQRLLLGHSRFTPKLEAASR